MAPDLQDIVEQAADLLRAPATLEDRDFHLVAYAAHGDTIDPVRMDSILHRRASETVRARFERHGIAAPRARSASRPTRPRPARPPLPARPLEQRDVRLPVAPGRQGAHNGHPGDQGDALCERAALLMARQARERDDLTWKVADLLSTHPETRTQAANDLTEAAAPKHP